MDLEHETEIENAPSFTVTIDKRCGVLRCQIKFKKRRFFELIWWLKRTIGAMADTHSKKEAAEATQDG